MQSSFFRLVIGVFACLLIFGFIGIVADGSRSLQQEKKEIDRVYTHGFQVGYTLAKSGAVKPNSNEVDAYARQSANALKDEGGLGFKMQWKNGFWAGWNKGD